MAPIIQTRVFWRVTEPQEVQLASAIEEVTQEVNNFLSTFSNLGDVLDIQYETRQIEKYGSRLLYSATVIYVQT